MDAQYIQGPIAHGPSPQVWVVENLQDGSPECYAEIANVVEHNGMLYFGSIGESAIGRIQLPK